MKNIHLLPTDKPSRLYKDGEKLKLDIDSYGVNNQHIYITSDEEIKEDDYYLGDDNHIYCLVTTVNSNGKKIILTTDQDLIADGVQAIDDEFLEWFVKNPSCEYVKITKDKIRQDKEFNDISHWNIYEYKISIPQEESKQETRVFGTEDDKSFWSDKPKQTCEHIKEYGCIKDICTCNTGPKQETLEEAAKRTYQKGLQDDIDLSFYDGVRLGAEWQAERMYSEVFEWLSSKDYLSDKMEFIQKEFEQFKKKD
jgi:hypothetical protein